MLIEQTQDILRRLKLTGMSDAYQQQLEQPETHNLSFDERFSLLVDRESLWRENRRLTRLLQMARLKQQACIEDIDYRHRRGLDRSQMASLATCDWIRAAHNTLIVGPTGCGKSWIACALGHQAVRQGLTVRYERVTRLFDTLRIAHADGSFQKRLVQLAKIDLLILDDWGLEKLTHSERHDLLEIMEDRHGAHSTLITSQLPVERWHDYLGDPTIADAILDRLLSAAHRIILKGESMRRKIKEGTSGQQENNGKELTEGEHSE